MRREEHEEGRNRRGVIGEWEEQEEGRDRRRGGTGGGREGRTGGGEEQEGSDRRMGGTGGGEG